MCIHHYEYGLNVYLLLLRMAYKATFYTLFSLLIFALSIALQKIVSSIQIDDKTNSHQKPQFLSFQF